jgi:hypothetical protein
MCIEVAALWHAASGVYDLALRSTSFYCVRPTHQKQACLLVSMLIRALIRNEDRLKRSPLWKLIPVLQLLGSTTGAQHCTASMKHVLPSKEVRALQPSIACGL